MGFGAKKGREINKPRYTIFIFVFPFGVFFLPPLVSFFAPACAFPKRNSPRSISQLRFQIQGSVRRAPRNEHLLFPPLYQIPQSRIKVYLKIVPAALTSMSTWPVAPMNAPVPPVTCFFVRVFCFSRSKSRGGRGAKEKIEKK